MRRIYLPGIVLTIVLMLLGILPTGLLTAPFSNTTVAAHEEASLGTHALDIVPRQVRDGSALRVGLHPGNAPLHLLFMLPFRDLAGLDAFLADVSNPRSANYGHYLTLKEANARFNPDVLHEERVQSWLRKSGFTDIHMSANHLYVEVSGDTAAFSTLLGVQINDYHTADRTFYAPDRAPTLPPSVANSIAWIHGLSNEAAWRTLPTMPQADTQAILNRNRLQTGEPAAANPNARATATATPTPTLGTPTVTRTATSTGTATNTPTVTSTPTPTPITNGTGNGSPPYNPQDLANAYDVNPLWTAGFNGQGQTIAIVSWFRPPTDTTLQRWASWTGAAAPTQANGRLVLVPIGNLGSTTCEDPGISGSAIESVAGMAYGATIRFYEIPSSGSCSLITFDAQNIATALNQAALDGSSVILETGLGDETAGAYSIYDHIYASNTATGHTYVAPSGWTGSASTFQPLRDPYPSYSAVSRYVTSVGRTRFSNSIGLTPAWPGEVAAAYTSAIGTALPDGSGGGFSLTPGTHPNWQVAPGFSTSETRRGYPDISVVGDSATGVFACWGDSATCGWVNVNVVGIWAGMIAVMNQYMIAQSRPTLGLVDPALYQLAGTSQPYAPYHDIMSGTNGAYNAGTGWDPVTGLGSPDLWNLARDLAAILPTLTPTNTPTWTPTPCPPVTGLTTTPGDDAFSMTVNSACNVLNTSLDIGRFYGPLDTNPTNIGHIDPRYLNVSVDSQAELVIWAFVQNSGVPDTVTINFAGQTRSFSPTDPGWVIWRIPVATADLLLPDKGSFPDPRLPLTPAVPPTPAANPLEITHTDTTGRGVKISNLQLSLPGMRPLVIASGFDIKSSNPHRPLYYADDDWDASLWGYLNPPATGTPNPLPYDQFSFYLPHDGRDSIVPTALPTSTGGGTTQGGGESMVPIIEGVKTMFGVQRVNILSHSMGGLWSREYVLNWDRKNSVDSLIMLGTPNGGSIIANAASIFYEFCVATSSLGGDCPKIIKRYEELSPAVSQLTTNYLEDYNNGRGKGPAPCVRYYDLAATNPAGGLAPDQFGINDEVVSVTSVETLPYSTHIPVITLPFVPLINGDVVHYHLPKDASVQATVEPYYNYKSNKSSDQCSSTASSSTHSPQGRGSTAPVSTTPTVEIRWPTVGDTISEGQTRTAMILVDSSNAATFALSWLNPTSTLSLSLIDPAGQVITPTSTYSGSSYSQIPDYFSGTTLMYMIAQPLVGTWQAVISAQTIYSDSESFYLGGNFVGGVQLDPAVSSKINTVGRPITLSTTLHDSAPISGAVVTASLILVTNGTAVSTVPLTEQPGGVYTGVFTPSVAGTYSVAIFAQGYNNQSEAFNRYSRLRFQASSGASLAGDFRDQAYDSTGTGLYDSLVISPTAAITQPGQYQMSGWLTTLDGRRLAYSTGVYTPTVGTVELPLSFPGRAIGAGGVDGPYQLRDLYFAQVISDELTVAAMPIAYTTTTYSRYAWVRAEVVQAGLATDRGLDMNNNGRYDYLEVTVPLDVRTTGTYNARLNLLAPDGNTITSADLPNLAFTQGTNAVTVRFSGPAIWASGKNGPYQVTDLLIWQSGQNPSTISSVLAQTTAYNSTDFEAPLPTPTATATVTLTPTRTPTITPTATATPAQDFILTVSPSNQTVTRPGSTTFTVQVNSVGGYSGTINLSVSGVPAKTTATFSPNPIVLTAGGTGTSTLTITTTNSTPQYVMNLTITGTDGIRSHSTTVAVIPQ